MLQSDLLKGEGPGALHTSSHQPPAECCWESQEGEALVHCPAGWAICVLGGAVSVERGAGEASGTEVKVLAVASLSGSTLKGATEHE